MKKFKYLLKFQKKIRKDLMVTFGLIIISALLTVIPPYVSKLILDEGVYGGQMMLIIKFSLILVLLYLLSFGIKYAIGVTLSKVSSKFVAELKTGIFENVLKMPMSFFDSKQTGYITERIREADSITVVFSPVFIQFLVSCISFFGAIVIVFSIKWELLIVIMCLTPFYWLLTNYASKNLKLASKALMEANAKTAGKLQENIGGISEVKSLNIGNKRLAEVTHELNDVAKRSIRKGRFLSLGAEGVQALSNISTAILTLAAGVMILKSDLTVGEYIAVTQYATIIFMPLQLFSNFNMMIQPAIMALKRIGEFFEGDKESNKGILFTDEIHTIEFDKVDFGYNQKEKILEEKSFKIIEKEKVAIIGPNGSGKTTILKLLLRLYKVNNGKILINGRDIEDYAVDSIRDKIGIVSQNIFMFSGTLRDNIKLVRPNIEDKEIINALVLSGWEEPDLNLFIAEGGKTLSGGQKQKIAIARMLIKNAELLVFDEATSNLDIETTEILTNAIFSVFKDKTCIFVSHDNSLVSKMDKVISLNKGVTI